MSYYDEDTTPTIEESLGKLQQEVTRKDGEFSKDLPGVFIRCAHSAADT